MHYCKSLQNLHLFDEVINSEILFRRDKGLYLTFDDGPSDFTPKILATLDRAGVEATFFINPSLVSNNTLPVLLQTSQQHTIAVHGFTHVDISKLSDKQLIHNIDACEEVLEAYNIQYKKLFRPPYGEIKKSQVSLLKSLGYDVVMWSRDTFDWKNNFSESVAYIKGNMMEGDIILLHDGAIENERCSIEMLNWILENYSGIYTFKKL